MAISPKFKTVHGQCHALNWIAVILLYVNSVIKAAKGVIIPGRVVVFLGELSRGDKIRERAAEPHNLRR